MPQTSQRQDGQARTEIVETGQAFLWPLDHCSWRSKEPLAMHEERSCLVCPGRQRASCHRFPRTMPYEKVRALERQGGCQSPSAKTSVRVSASQSASSGSGSSRTSSPTRTIGGSRETSSGPSSGSTRTRRSVSTSPSFRSSNGSRMTSRSPTGSCSPKARSTRLRDSGSRARPQTAA